MEEKSQVYLVVEDLIQEVIYQSDQEMRFVAFPSHRASEPSDDISLSDDDISLSDDDISLSSDDDYPPSLRLSDRNVVRTLFSDDGEPIGEIDPTPHSRFCCVCNFTEYHVNDRIGTAYGPMDILQESEGGVHLCTSCSRYLDEGGRLCQHCGVNENLGRPYGLTFPCNESEESSWSDTCCSICNDSFPDLETQLEMIYGIYGDDTYSDDTYEGEYENEDMPENNTEKVKKIKNTIGDIGEIMFDIQEKMSEGEYLKVMDLLQSATNGLNGL